MYYVTLLVGRYRSTREREEKKGKSERQFLIEKENRNPINPGQTVVKLHKPFIAFHAPAQFQERGVNGRLMWAHIACISFLYIRVIF